MTKADYIRQVDAMALPDSLQQRLGALAGPRAGLEPTLTKGTEDTWATAGRPYEGRRTQKTRATAGRPYGRWATLAAALVLVVGLGVAAPVLLRAITPPGGEIVKPTHIPEGIIYDDVDVPDVVLNAAKSYVWERLVWLSEHSGVTEFVDGQWQETDTGALPIFDNWRIESLTPCYEEQPIPKDAGQYTVSIYRLNYRLHTTTPERVILAGATKVDEEGWYLDTYPDSTYMVFLHEGGQMRYVFTTMINDSGPGNALFESDILGQLEETLGAEGTLSDEELTELLAAQLDTGGATGGFQLLFRSQRNGQTIGVVKYTQETSDTTDSTLLNNILILGTFDNRTRQLVDEPGFLAGDSTDFAVFNPPGSTDPYLLCTATILLDGQGANCGVALFSTEGNILTQVSDIPGIELPTDVQERLKSGQTGEGYSSDLRLVPSYGGIEVFRRNPELPFNAEASTLSYWLFDRYLPIDRNAPPAGIMEALRRFYDTFLTPMSSPYYTISTCKLLTGDGRYIDQEYPDAQVYEVSVSPNAVPLYFLFDAEDKLLGTRSMPDSSLTIDGRVYPLGIGIRGIFGIPSATNAGAGGYIDDDTVYEVYSEWFAPDSRNSCGYTYYPVSGRYYLSNINTVREDAYTARGIHVGNTVAEVLAAYPQSEPTEIGPQTNYISYQMPNASLEFYFDPAETAEVAMGRTITSISLSTPVWVEG